ncbi:phosphoribosyltransferase [Microtetraspora malaysiensis]|uniref:Phosphoribosyltransferase n=1 Tax=Microtetraspora malaysiensis TaxID=161358 RepID=A0ABW6SKK1_9ACTN
MTTTRVFEGRRIWRMHDAAFAAAVDLIAEAERAHQPELIVGIQRGGAQLALRLAAALNVPSVLVTARHNTSDAIAVQASGVVTVDAAPLVSVIPAARVLLVDDICGSGATLRAVTRLIVAAVGAERIRSAVLCRNAGADLSPDTWVWEVADWVSFPWETPPDQVTSPLAIPQEVRS